MKTSTETIILLLAIIGVIIFGFYIITSEGFQNYIKTNPPSYYSKIDVVEIQIRSDINSNMSITEVMDIITFNCELQFPRMVGKYGNGDFTKCKIDMKPKFINSTI